MGWVVERVDLEVDEGVYGSSGGGAMAVLPCARNNCHLDARTMLLLQIAFLAPGKKLQHPARASASAC